MTNFRHGDLALIQVKKLPVNLKKSTSNVLMVGSGGNPHTFEGGELYLKEKDEMVIGYLVAKNTILFHSEHGEDVGKSLREAKIQDGIYELRKQFEYTNEGLRQVED